MEWKGSRVAVTGAGGFIGSHLVERLVGLGAEVRALVHYNSRDAWGHLDDLDPGVMTHVDVRSGDIADPRCVMDFAEGSDVVFHLAALISIPYSYRAPISFVQTNVHGTLNILEAARSHGTARVVHTSTSEVYGTALYTPIDEAHAIQTQSPYSASKASADGLAAAYHRSFEIPVVTVRPFNTYGPRQSGRAVIPTIISQVLARGEVRLGSLAPRRDFTYVADTVGGFIKAAEAETAVGQVLNLGTGQGISVGDLAETIFRLVGREPRIVTEQERVRPQASEVWDLLSDASRARDLIGWTPSVSLEEGLTRTIDWFRPHLDRYRTGRYTV